MTRQLAAQLAYPGVEFITMIATSGKRAFRLLEQRFSALPILQPCEPIGFCE
jgi:hypothetical protein